MREKLLSLLEQLQRLTPSYEAQLQNVRTVERHIILPIKALGLPVVAWFAFWNLYRTPVSTNWEIAMQNVYLFFIAYCMISIAWGFLIWGANGLKRWQLSTVVFCGILMDTLFIGGVTVGSKGFDSSTFWIFALWIIRSAICMPGFLQQCWLSGLICVIYVLAGLTENWAVQADGFEREAFVEPVVLRIFFLAMLSTCATGVHLALVRRAQIKEEAQEFILRQEQIRANGRLAAEIAHQLKNPLGIINNVVFTIQRKVERGDKDIGGQIKIIREEIERSDSIITDLMGYAKLAEGALERLAINDELDTALTMVFPKGASFGINITKEYAQGLPHILMQRNHLSEILVNLLSNARDILDGTGQIAVRTKFGNDYAVIVEIADNGPGIETSIKDQIWTPYFTTKQKGTGLGLAIVKHNVEMYSGTIEVFSDIGYGTCFRIKLPARSLLKLKNKQI